MLYNYSVCKLFNLVRFSKYAVYFARPIYCNCVKSSLFTSSSAKVDLMLNGGRDLGLKILSRSTLGVVNVESRCSKHSKVDTSKVPVLCEDELEEWFVKGSGPGGSNVNKRTNCCTLRHKPSGIIVKCHLARDLSQNRKLARKMMIEKLDEHYNGEESIKAQKERLEIRREQAMEQKSKKSLDLKKKYKDLLLKSDNDNTGDFSDSIIESTTSKSTSS